MRAWRARRGLDGGEHGGTIDKPEQASWIQLSAPAPSPAPSPGRGIENAAQTRQDALVKKTPAVLAPPLESIRTEVIDRFRAALAQDEDATVFANLLDVEQQLEAFVHELGHELVQSFVDERLEQALACRTTCPSCSDPMEVHRRTGWQHGTALGPIQVRDVYLYCRCCHVSARPLHGWLGTDRERWSLGAEQAALDLACDESCQHAADKLERHHPGLSMERTTVLRMMHKHGAQARQFIEGKLGSALEQLGHEGRSSGGLAELEVEHDGGMIPVGVLVPLPLGQGQPPERTPVRDLPKRRRNSFWQEVKLGLVQVPGETTRLYTARPTDELDEAFRDLLALGALKGWTEQTHVRGIADGARHIRDRLQETFHACPFQFILDRPHASEHLTEAAEALATTTGCEAKAWSRTAMARIEAGEVMAVVDELRQGHRQQPDDRLRLNADYFERNRDSVAYAEYRARGWSQASSEVESAHRHVVQQRMKIPGAWWHPDNVPGVLALRMLRANGWWDEYWSEQRRSWRERAQTFRRIQPPAADLAHAA